MNKYELNTIYRKYVLDKLNELINKPKDEHNETDRYTITEDEESISLDFSYETLLKEEVTCFFSFYNNNKYPSVINMYITIIRDKEQQICYNENLLEVVNIPELYGLILEAKDTAYKNQSYTVEEGITLWQL